MIEMGKKLVRSEEDIRKSMTLPSGNDVLGFVTRILGQRRLFARALTLPRIFLFAREINCEHSVT